MPLLRCSSQWPDTSPGPRSSEMISSTTDDLLKMCTCLVQWESLGSLGWPRQCQTEEASDRRAVGWKNWRRQSCFRHGASACDQLWGSVLLGKVRKKENGETWFAMLHCSRGIYLCLGNYDVYHCMCHKGQIFCGNFPPILAAEHVRVQVNLYL